MPTRDKTRPSGRIHPHERDTDDAVPIIGGGNTITVEHATAIQGTKDKSMKIKSRQSHRNRLKHIYKFWSSDYTNYYEAGTYALTPEQKNDPILFHHTNDRDLIYKGLDVKCVLAFLVTKKQKANGNLASVSDISKYHDAIKWGAQIANQHLPTAYYEEMDMFLIAYKKEHADAAKDGNVDSREADPINSSLFMLICQWALEDMNILVWVYSLLMWHNMARSISISTMALHNIKRGSSDSIEIKYDLSKADQSGEFVQTKNCYANPTSPHLCLYLSLGVYLSLNSESFESTEKLFVRSGTKDNTGSQTYCRQLTELVKRHWQEAMLFLRMDHFSAHGVRKGSATHASSATTLPPAFTSIAARGEWSRGKILDIYFQFAMGGDYYLGRLLTLIDPEDEMFATLPPHWKDEMHPAVRRGIEITFGKLLTCHVNTDHNPIGVLSFLLASMVHHSDFLYEEIHKHAAHPFLNIPLLNDANLLMELKEQVTLEPTDTVKFATGVPPHVTHSKAIKEVLCVSIANSNRLDKFAADLKEAVSEAIDAKVTADGGMNQATMKTAMEGMLTVFRADLCNDLRMSTSGRNVESNEVNPASIGHTNTCTPTANQFQYQDSKGVMRFWCLPKPFAFSHETKRWAGWRKWLTGATVVDADGSRWHTKPFRHLRSKDFHSPLMQRAFAGEWKPIFSVMMEAPDITIPSIVIDITEDILVSSYAIATVHLQENFSYIFQQTEDTLSKYTIGTWSKKVKRSEVLKRGTTRDKSRLPPATNFNKSKKKKECDDMLEDKARNPRRKLNKVGKQLKVTQETDEDIDKA